MPLKEILESVFHGRLPPPLAMPEQMLDIVAMLSSIRGRVCELNPIERLLTTMRHKEPDHVPCATLIGGASRQLTGASFDVFSQDLQTAIKAGLLALDLVGGDVQMLGMDLSVEASDFGQPVIYPENSTAYPDYDRPIIRDHTQYRKIRPINIKKAPRMQKVVEMARTSIQKKGLDAVFVPVVSSPLSVLAMMTGAQNAFKDCVLHPKDVMAALEVITGVLIDYIHALCDTGLLVIAPDMLFAAKSGLGKKLWEKIEGPFGREIANAIHDKNCIVAIHNCGDGPCFDSMIKFMEPEAISFARLPEDCKDRKELKKRYGGKTTLIGNVETALLSHGGPHEVIDECKRIIDDLAPGGGFVLAPGCEYPPNANLLNAFVLVEAARIYG